MAPAWRMEPLAWLLQVQLTRPYCATCHVTHNEDVRKLSNSLTTLHCHPPIHPPFSCYTTGQSLHQLFISLRPVQVKCLPLILVLLSLWQVTSIFRHQIPHETLSFGRCLTGGGTTTIHRGSVDLSEWGGCCVGDNGNLIPNVGRPTGRSGSSSSPRQEQDEGDDENVKLR